MRERRGEQRDFVIKFVKSMKASRQVSVRNTNDERRTRGCGEVDLEGGELQIDVHHQRDRKHKL